jgi:hypothetical protein
LNISIIIVQDVSEEINVEQPTKQKIENPQFCASQKSTKIGQFLTLENFVTIKIFVESVKIFN